MVLRSLWRARIRLLIAAVLLLTISYTLTPYDSPIRSFFRFHSNVAHQRLLSPDRWVDDPAVYSVDPETDIGIIVKTGFGTRHRVPKLLDALFKESFTADMVVVQDYPVLEDEKYLMPDGRPIPIIDAIGWSLEQGSLFDREYERVSKYERIVDAVNAADWPRAESVAKEVGWELDTMKFIPALQYVGETFPHKKWYLLLDDDTYIIRSSLQFLLSHLNFEKPYYLGNPVGDYKARFAHGGSAVVLSGAAMYQLLHHNSRILSQAYQESTTAPWGDKLLSTTLMKLGIYLDESYRLLFNGEPPGLTRLTLDRVCLPLISFHGLGAGNAELMEQVGEDFKPANATTMNNPFFWFQLAQSLDSAEDEDFWDSFHTKPIRQGHNFVGEPNEYFTFFPAVPSIKGCIAKCDDNKECVAWTWIQDKQECHTTSALIPRRDSRVSGDNQVFSGISKKMLDRVASCSGRKNRQWS